MNYGGNMPDWHQYNAQQTGRTPSASSSTTSSTSNSHLYIGGTSSAALDGINLSSEQRHRSSGKHQNDGGYAAAAAAARNYSLGTAGMHMSGSLANCVPAHYSTSTSSRNPMMESIPALGMSVGGPIVTDDIATPHRNSQTGFVSATGGNSGNSLNSTIHSSNIGSQNSALGSGSPVRPSVVPAVQPYVPCKAPCCNPDPNIYQQHWEKFAHYPNNATTYRDNIRQTSGYPSPIDGRRYLPNGRKDCHESKDIIETVSYNGGPRSFTDYSKYARKESVAARNYGSNGILHQNYPMQNYQFSADCQKCPYSGKEYGGRRGASNNTIGSPVGVPKNPGMMKYHEQQQSVIVQQKYPYSKQMQYQNNPGTPNSGLITSSPSQNLNNLPSALQNSYYNSGNPTRDYCRDYSAQDQSIMANRIAQTSANSHAHGSFQKYHVYHQKIAMQRFTMENHLRAFTRIPGYQSHPKYQECVMRYRELLRLQQTVDYQNVVPESPKVPSPLTTTTATTAVPPINLQFDQNGVLINSSYVTPNTFNYETGIPGPVIVGSNETSNRETNETLRNSASRGSFENPVCFSDRSDDKTVENGDESLDSRTSVDSSRENETHRVESEESGRNEYAEQPQAGGEKMTPEINDSVRTEIDDNDNTKSCVSPATNSMTSEYRISCDFADKPELDVRQFLANWDESEGEEPVTNVDEETRGHENKETNIRSSKIDTPKIVQEEKAQPEANKPDDVNEMEISVKKIGEIECARSTVDIDEIPTIHIVENLDGGTDMEKIHTVFGNLTSAILGPISICEGTTGIGEIEASNVNEAETIVLFEQREICSESLEFDLITEKIVNADTAEGETEQIVESATIREESEEIVKINRDTEEKEQEIVPAEPSIDIPEEKTIDEPTTTTTTTITTTTTARTSDTNNSSDSSSSSSCRTNDSNSVETTNLRKQSSFTSDESHNPDDISLPDLQTSECTPISTTLNTPIHSDSEESSEHVSDLTISTNPIEIIQNSPIISFTHSPIKIEPYEQLNRSRAMSDEGTVGDRHAPLNFDFDEEVANNENRKYNENCDSSGESVVEELENQARDSIYEKCASAMKNCNGGSEDNSDKDDDYYGDPLVGMAPLTTPQADETSTLEDSNGVGENPSNKLHNEKCSSRIMEREDEEEGGSDDNDFDRPEDLEKLCDMSLDESCMIPLIPEDVCENQRLSPIEANSLTKMINDALPIDDLNILETSGNEIIEESGCDNNVWKHVDELDKDNGSNVLEETTERTKDDSTIAEPTKFITRTDQSSLDNVQNQFEDNHRETLNDHEIVKDFEDRKIEERISSPLRRKCCSSGKESDVTPEETIRANNQVSSSDKESVENSTISSSKEDENAYTSKRHIASNVEIQVANFNVKIHNDAMEKMRKDARRNEEAMVEGVGAIEIKINLSHCDTSRKIVKKVEDKTRDELTENRKRKKIGTSNRLGRICCRRRRGSMPETINDIESKKMRKMNDENRSVKKISKYRRNRKIRRSMDDELLLNHEKLYDDDTDTSSDPTILRENPIFYDRGWPRDKKIEDLPIIQTTKENETIEEDDKKISSRRKMYSRHDQRQDYPRLPSPSYNSFADNSSTLDFDNFDVAPNRKNETDEDEEVTEENALRTREKLLVDDACEHSMMKSSTTNPNDEVTCIDALEKNLNTVPIYTTKDGRITYSPNRNYTYRALIIEARQREKHLRGSRRFNSSRNDHRDANVRRKFPRNFVRLDDKRSRGKTSTRPKRGSSVRNSRHHFFDDINDRSDVRMKKHENRCKTSTDPKIATELKIIHDDDKERTRLDKSMEKVVADSRELETAIDSTRIVMDDQEEMTKQQTPNHRSTIVARNDPIREKSPSLSLEDRKIDNRDTNIGIKMFQGQEIEVTSRTVENSIADRPEIFTEGQKCDPTLRFFRDDSRSVKAMDIVMASPSTSITEKRPQVWDLDCHTAMSDSGLESSTTYVEARKESRKIQKWKNSFVRRVETERSLFCISREKREEMEVTRYEANETEETVISTRLNDIETRRNGIEEIVKVDDMKISQSEMEKLVPETITDRQNDEPKGIVENPEHTIGSSDVERKKHRGRKERDDERGKKLSAESTEITFRKCVSNESGDFAGLFSQVSKNLDETRNFNDEIIIAASFNKEEKELEESHNIETLETKKIPETCKDYLIDTCTSFSSCIKLSDTSRGLQVEPEVSTLDNIVEDTSTRFASESMDFNDICHLGDNENLMDNLLSSGIDENAVDPSIDLSRKSNDSILSKDSGKAPILSFSGQIQSDSSLIDASSKSPPDLTCEDNFTSGVTAANDISEKSLVEKSLEIPVIKSQSKDERNDKESLSHPKIPKMIIRNIRSRPGTPTAVEEKDRREEIGEKVITDIGSERGGNEINETKIPKMKIRLEDNHLPRMIVENSRTKVDDKKIKSKSTSKSANNRSSKTDGKLPLVGKLSRQSSEGETQDFRESTESCCGSYKFTLMDKSSSKSHRHRSRSKEKVSSKNHHHHHHHHRNRSRSKEKSSEEAKRDKIPKLTIKKRSSHSSKRRDDEILGDIATKRRKITTKGDETSVSNSLDDNDVSNDNNDSRQSLAEKVPKVIIKRASASAEFKCELSKNDRDAIIKDSKWQPEVKLRRFWVLDCMAKEPGNGQVALKVLQSTLDPIDKEIFDDSAPRKNRKGNRSSSVLTDVREKTLCNVKTRRKSDCGVNESNISDCIKRRKSFESERIEGSSNFSDIIKINHLSSYPSRPDNIRETLMKNDNKKIEEKSSTKRSLKESQSSFDENSSVIKLDSSDESQTTIELLPASPDNSQPEIDANNQYFNGTMEKLYSDDAIPTQFELELEIVDNSTIDCLDVPIPDCSSSRKDIDSEERAIVCQKSKREIETKRNVEKNTSITADVRNTCCSDSLVEKVLAAKETLRRCLSTKTTLSRTEKRTKPRPKTAAEKKQGLSYDYVVPEVPDGTENRFKENEKLGVFQKNGNESSKRDKLSREQDDRTRNESKQKKASIQSTETARNVNGVDTKCSSSPTSRERAKKSMPKVENSIDASSKMVASGRKNTTQTIEKQSKDETVKTNIETREETTKNVKPYKIPKISRSRETDNDTSCCGSSSERTKISTEKNEETRKSPSPGKMPILEPQIDLDFELSGRDADRDNSRSPPVITKQEDSVTLQTLKKLEDNADTGKLDVIEKQRDNNEAVTFADIVSQLAYHEKATIRHRRYCTLCERWFPTAARHRRHLTGYQHRHTELTQRRTVHALFMLFTGKPCPRLLPASIVRTDCLPGEPTPLQIAVQDVAISLEDGARVKPSKNINDKDE